MCPTFSADEEACNGAAGAAAKSAAEEADADAVIEGGKVEEGAAGSEPLLAIDSSLVRKEGNFWGCLQINLEIKCNRKYSIA